MESKRISKAVQPAQQGQWTTWESYKDQSREIWLIYEEIWLLRGVYFWHKEAPQFARNTCRNITLRMPTIVVGSSGQWWRNEALSPGLVINKSRHIHLGGTDNILGRQNGAK